MTHLTRTTQKNIFETTVAKRSSLRDETGAAPGLDVAYPSREAKPFAVMVDQTPEQARCTRNANYPNYDWPSVQNLAPRSRGHRY